MLVGVGVSARGTTVLVTPAAGVGEGLITKVVGVCVGSASVGATVGEAATNVAVGVGVPSTGAGVDAGTGVKVGTGVGVELGTGVGVFGTGVGVALLVGLAPTSVGATVAAKAGEAIPTIPGFVEVPASSSSITAMKATITRALRSVRIGGLSNLSIWDGNSGKRHDCPTAAENSGRCCSAHWCSPAMERRPSWYPSPP